MFDEKLIVDMARRCGLKHPDVVWNTHRVGRTTGMLLGMLVYLEQNPGKDVLLCSTTVGYSRELLGRLKRMAKTAGVNLDRSQVRTISRKYVRGQTNRIFNDHFYAPRESIDSYDTACLINEYVDLRELKEELSDVYADNAGDA